VGFHDDSLLFPFVPFVVQLNSLTGRRYIFKHKSSQKPVRSGTQEARIKMKWDFGRRKSEVGFHDDFLLFPFVPVVVQKYATCVGVIYQVELEAPYSGSEVRKIGQPGRVNRLFIQPCLEVYSDRLLDTWITPSNSLLRFLFLE